MSTIVEYLQTAHRIISAAPPESIDLYSFGTVTPCGTLHCSLGWLAVSEEFKEHLKLRWQNDGPHVYATVVTSADGYLLSRDLDRLFGHDAFNVLFASRGEGNLDEAWPGLQAGRKRGSDQELALWRLDHQLISEKILAIQEVQDLFELTMNSLETHDWAIFETVGRADGVHRTLRVLLGRDWDDVDLGALVKRAVDALHRRGHLVTSSVTQDGLYNVIELSIG